MKSHFKPMLIMLLLTALLLGGIFAWKMFVWQKMQQYFATLKTPTVTVSTVKADYQDWQPQIKASGSLNAVLGVDITTEVPGVIKAIRFSSGAQVKSGDILVELNDSADLARLHSLKAAADLAQTVYKRDKALFAAKAISKAALEADQADLKSKMALVAEQAALVAKKTIRAPFPGRLGICAVKPGDYINPGVKIVTLQSLNPLFVDFYVPQQVISKIAVNQVVSLTTDAYPSKFFTGKITAIDSKVDAATRNVKVEALLPNPHLELLPGMFASIEIVTGELQRYLTLPQTAISYNPYGEIVYLIKEGKKNEKGEPVLIASQSFVTLGETRGDQVAVLAGLKRGDTVVSAGQLKLKNGAAVTINNSVLPNNNPRPHSIDE